MPTQTETEKGSGENASSHPPLKPLALDRFSRGYFESRGLKSEEIDAVVIPFFADHANTTLNRQMVPTLAVKRIKTAYAERLNAERRERIDAEGRRDAAIMPDPKPALSERVQRSIVNLKSKTPRSVLRTVRGRA